MSSESKAISIYNDVRAYTELMAMFNNNISDICVFSKNFSSDNTKMIVINNPTGDIIVDNFINNLKKIIDIENCEIMNKDISFLINPLKLFAFNILNDFEKCEFLKNMGLWHLVKHTYMQMNCSYEYTHCHSMSYMIYNILYIILK